jgi:ArsR family transcriptional regulator, virulence genes transcriptional regulator
MNTNIIKFPDTGTLEERAFEASQLLSAMANANRLMVLCKLVEGEMNVTALSCSIGLSQSALSQHLAKLRERGLVATRRDAQTIYYSLASDDVRAVLLTLHKLYCG